MKSKLCAARARLDQLNPSKVAAPHRVQPQHKPGKSSMDQPESENPNQHMQPAHLRSNHPLDMRIGLQPPSQQLQKDDNVISLHANAHAMVRPTVVQDEDVQEDFDLCVICIEVTPQVRFQPCSRVVTCKPCASKVLLQTGECPYVQVPAFRA